SCENDRYRRNLPHAARCFRWKSSWFEVPRLIVITGNEAILPHRSKEYPKGLAYVPGPMIGGPLSLPALRLDARNRRISPRLHGSGRPVASIPKLAAAVNFQGVDFGMGIRTAERPIAGKIKALSRGFRKRP